MGNQSRKPHSAAEVRAGRQPARERSATEIDWGRLLPEVARILFGDPTSKGRGEWRYGRQGSLKINLPGNPYAGGWYCFETGTSGGVVDLIEREAGLSPENRHAAAKKWLRDRDLIPAAGERPAKQSPEPPPHSDTAAPAETRSPYFTRRQGPCAPPRRRPLMGCRTSG